MSQVAFESDVGLSADVIGLSLTRDGFSVLAKKGRIAREICAQRGTNHWFDERGGVTKDFDYSGVRNATSALCEYAPVHLVLPNPTIRFLTLRTTERPRSRKETEQLLHWHSERLGTPLGASAFLDYQWTGKSGKEHNLFAISAPGEFLQSLLKTVEPHCVRYLLPSIVYLLKSVANADEGTLVIDFEEDSWAVLVFDQDGHVRLARTGWRYPSDQPETIAVEARRLVNAAGKGCEPRNITVWCQPSEWKGLEEALQRNFSATPAVNIHSDEVQSKAALAVFI